jgi:hypothetical protein
MQSQPNLEPIRTSTPDPKLTSKDLSADSKSY